MHSLLISTKSVSNHFLRHRPVCMVCQAGNDSAGKTDFKYSVLTPCDINWLNPSSGRPVGKSWPKCPFQTCDWSVKSILVSDWLSTLDLNVLYKAPDNPTWTWTQHQRIIFFYHILNIFYRRRNMRADQQIAELYKTMYAKANVNFDCEPTWRPIVF